MVWGLVALADETGSPSNYRVHATYRPRPSNNTGLRSIHANLEWFRSCIAPPRTPALDPTRKDQPRRLHGQVQAQSNQTCDIRCSDWIQHVAPGLCDALPSIRAQRRDGCKVHGL